MGSTTLRHLLEVRARTTALRHTTHQMERALDCKLLALALRYASVMEAERRGLRTQSLGIGGARSLRILPHGAQPEEPAAPTKDLAALVFRWCRTAAEQEHDQARPAPYSLGEVAEMLHGEAEGTSLLPPALAVLGARARNVKLTSPQQKTGEHIGRSTQASYLRQMTIRHHTSYS